MAEKKLREFAPQESFARLTLEEKMAALHRGFLVLFMRSRRLQTEVARLRKRVEDLGSGRIKNRA